MALKFGPQWLRDLSDSGAGTTQPHSPTIGTTKFKLADYRYGREEMLSLWNHNSPPPDQVRKHLPIFSKEIQKPITMMPLTEDEQRLVSQGFNSTGVLRAAGRGSAPTLRVTRGGGTADRGRGRGRGRGEGYVPRSENGDVGYHRTTQEGWEQVGRKLERSYSRGYVEESAENTNRTFSRSASDNNWRDKRQEEEDEEEQRGEQRDGGGWRAPQNRDTRWGPQGSQGRRDWRDPPRDLSGFEGDRRLPPHRRGYDSNMRGPRRTSESHDNEGEVPEWVEDDAGDDPGTFDSSGAFVSTKDGRRYPDPRYDGGNGEDHERRRRVHVGGGHAQHSNQEGPESPHTPGGSRKYVPPNARNGSGHGGGGGGMGDEAGSSGTQGENGDVQQQSAGRKACVNGASSSAEKGDGDCGFAFPHSEEVDGSSAPPGQYSHSPHSLPTQSSAGGAGGGGGVDQQKRQQRGPDRPTSAATSAASAAFSLPATETAPQPAPSQQIHQEGGGGEPGLTTNSSTRPPRPTLVDPAFAHVEKSLQNLVAQMTMDAEKDGQPRDVSREALPLTHEHANKWFYKDPQGVIQGPFTNDEMSQWFGAGYFTMSLVVKRGCDDSFKQLGELIKRYGRVPFLPGTPLPPLISTTTPVSDPSLAAVNPVSSPQLPVNPVSIGSLGAQSMPSMVNPSMPSLVNPVQDPLLSQMMLLQQEYLKQTFVMRQLQLQTLQQLQQDQENFGSLAPEQQQHVSMQVMMQTNPMLMQQLQHIQQQQLLLQQQLQHQQHQHLASHSTSVTPSEESAPKTFPQAQQHGSSVTLPSAASSSSSLSSSSATAAVTAAKHEEAPHSVWGNMSRRQQQQPPQPTASVWSHRPAQPQPSQPTSLWDVDAGSEPAYKAQMDKLKRAREEDRLREEERLRQEELERKQEELRRQQEELEQQREQVRREKEELDRQKHMDVQKRDEARRREEEARRQEDERIQKEIEKQRREQKESEKKRQEEDKKRDKELRKQEEKKRKEEEKRRIAEEQKIQEEMRRKQALEEEEQRLLQLQREQERRLQADLQQQEREEREEEERLQREAAERDRADREKAEAHKRQLELQRQNESLRRLQQAQREQLANMQLPAHSNWAKQQQQQQHQGGGQAGPTQSRSLTEIQQEEARREHERLIRQQQEMQKMQEQASFLNQQNQQKSWATHASTGVSNRGPSLLDIQQQEQENMKKNQKDKPKTATYTSKLSSLVGGASTWSSGPPSSGWPSNTSSSVWGDSGPSGGANIWGDQPAVATPPPRRHQPKESGEFPALKNPAQQNKKAAAKANAKAAKGGAGSKQKKDEETVQKLFQTRQQDDFTKWVTDKVSRFSAQIDVPTFVSFIVEVDSPDDVRDYMMSYLGDNKESRDFAKQFVDKRNRSRNQARLEKQQEEDSIWGPAPAVNPHIQARPAGGGGNNNNTTMGSGDVGEGGSAGGGKAGKAAKKKKQKMQKLDASSFLGFTVHSDPNRKNAAGELEGVQ